MFRTKLRGLSKLAWKLTGEEIVRRALLQEGVPVRVRWKLKEEAKFQTRNGETDAGSFDLAGKHPGIARNILVSADAALLLVFGVTVRQKLMKEL